MEEQMHDSPVDGVINHGGEDMLAADVEEQVTGERHHRLKSQLRQLERVAWLVGNPSLLYCWACRAAVSSEHAIEGALDDWPYCPIHKKKPLTIHSAMHR